LESSESGKGIGSVDDVSGEDSGVGLASEVDLLVSLPIVSAMVVESTAEGEGVFLERSLPLGGVGRRQIPPRPRDDSPPEPVVRRVGGGHFHRLPSVDEALGELTRPREELSRTEAAAARIRSCGRGKGSGAMRSLEAGEFRQSFTPQQRLLLLDTWTRSGLPSGDFAVLVGVSKHTLYHWKKRFEESGPAGLEDGPRGGGSSRSVPEITRRAILLLKRSHPEYGCERISDLLARGPALPASAGTVGKVLREAGYESVESPTRPHPAKACRFERAEPNSLWQTDLFTFVLKRQNRRLHLAAFMDDHSRFIVGWGLFSSPSTEMVVETLKSAVSSFQAPRELLTDNGPQYVTWRGKSKFSEACVSLGIRQIVARPRRPQTLGKVERFWGTLWREFLATAIFAEVTEARQRIGGFVDHYNFQRPHQSLSGLTPADRYFGRAEEVKREIRRRLEENAAILGRAMEKADLEFGERAFTPEGPLPVDSRVDAVPGPGIDVLSEGLSAVAGLCGKGTGHEG
jgi:transposase InsO family protein